MKRGSALPYLLLVATLFALLHLPERVVSHARSATLNLTTPIFLGVKAVLSLASWTKGGGRAGSHGDQDKMRDELLLCRLENSRLKEQLSYLLDLDRYHEEILLQLERLIALGQPEGDELKVQLTRHRQHLVARIKAHLEAVPARVLFRPTLVYSHTLWLNVGTEEMRSLAYPVLQKNSPVVLGSALVGVVDEIAPHHCRVRLITDPGLRVSVRALRGGGSDAELLGHILAVQEGLASRGDLFPSSDAPGILHQNLEVLKSRLDPLGQEILLAKGELAGSGEPLFRSSGTLLRAVGFNYDLPDAEGPARSLRTAPSGPSGSVRGGTPILAMGDLLVTTGMDGIFPPGLEIGRVVSIDPLREGSYTYSLRAVAGSRDLNSLSTLFILPPWNSDGASFSKTCP